MDNEYKTTLTLSGVQLDSDALAKAFTLKPINYPSIRIGYDFGFNNKKQLPKKYIINKGATILFWDEDEQEKTIVKRSKDDKFNKRLGFLTAYFQYHSGLSKTQANKYLDSLEVEKEK